MRTSPLLADFIQARGCKPICEKLLTLPRRISLADSDSQKIKENGNAYQPEEKKVRKNRCCMVCWLPCSSGLCCGYSVENQNGKLELSKIVKPYRLRFFLLLLKQYL